MVETVTVSIMAEQKCFIEIILEILYLIDNGLSYWILLLFWLPGFAEHFSKVIENLIDAAICFLGQTDMWL